MRTRVKICGITRAKDAMKAVELGADAIGLVFYEKSPRAVSIDSARAVIQKLPPFVTIVGLFVDPSAKDVAAVVHHVSLDLLQFQTSLIDAQMQGLPRFIFKLWYLSTLSY